jgi:hypothetical protein
MSMHAAAPSPDGTKADDGMWDDDAPTMEVAVGSLEPAADLPRLTDCVRTEYRSATRQQ